MHRSSTPAEKYTNYMARFQVATKNTIDNGLEIDNVIEHATPSTGEIIVGACMEAFNSKEHMAHNCPHSAIVNDLLQRFGFNTGQITIGYISYNNDYEFQCDLPKLLEEVDTLSDNTLPAHVWITFPDGTICDPTVFATFEKDAGRLESRPIETLPLIYSSSFEGFPCEMEYFPLLVGRDYLVRANALIEAETKTVLIGKEVAKNLYHTHLLKNETASFNDMKAYYKTNEPDKYRELVIGFRMQMNDYVKKGLVKAQKDNNDTLYYAV